MAKQIKSIKCPQCGSTRKTKLGKDRYLCSNCSTEYYLQSNDITVNVNHNHSFQEGAHPVWEEAGRSKLSVVAATAILIITSAFLIAFILTLGGNSQSGYSTAGTSAGPRQTTEREPEISYNYTRHTGFENPGNRRPVTLMTGLKTVDNDRFAEMKEVEAVYYDPLDETVLKTEILMEVSGRDFSGSGNEFRVMESGDIYYLLENNLYRLNKSSLSLENVMDRLLGGIPELDKGIAKIRFRSRRYGDSLELLTNENKTYYFYPATGKIYSEEAFRDARSSDREMTPEAGEAFYFAFSSESIYYKEEKTQLFRFRYINNKGGPKELPWRIAWDRDYGGSGIFTDRDPYTRVLVNPMAKENARILSYEDITPDRDYFEPSVLNFTQEEVFIYFKPDINPNTSYSVQCLDARTADVKWTYHTPDKYVRHVNPAGDYYIIATSNSTITVDKNGQEVSEFSR